LRLLKRLIALLLVFGITIAFADLVLNIVEYFQFVSGWPLSSQWNLQHSAWHVFLLGFLAGLLSASRLFAVFLFFNPPNDPALPGARRFFANLNLNPLQPWIWLAVIPLLFLIVSQWTESLSHAPKVSVSTSPYTISSFVQFWNADLQPADPLSPTYVSDWDVHSPVFHIWVIALFTGYSLASILRKLWHSVYRGNPSRPG